MFDEVRSAVATLKTVVRELEPGVLDGQGAVQLVELFAEAEHVCAAGKAIATQRVEETGAYRASGHRSAGELLAAVSGVTVGAAESALRTARRLEELPATDQAFRPGSCPRSRPGRSPMPRPRTRRRRRSCCAGRRASR
jgi:hypothetical protein